jgi:hypothetical protein
MPTLDIVRQMKQRGDDDATIARTLQEQGISPREINDALSQSQIKDAVSPAPSMQTPPAQTQQFNPNQSQQLTSNNAEQLQPGMQPSMMSDPDTPAGNLEPLPQEGPHAQEVRGLPIPGQPMQAPPMQGYDDEVYEDYDNQFAPESYGPQAYEQPYGNQGYSNQGYADSNMAEIADQIVNEKITKINSTLNDITEVKTLLTSRVEKIDERLSRVESIIDQLHASLLRKASEQEQNITDIKSELEGMRTGFSKVLNPLIDIERELEKPKRKRKTTKRKTKKKKK